MCGQHYGACFAIVFARPACCSHSINHCDDDDDDDDDDGIISVLFVVYRRIVRISRPLSGLRLRAVVQWYVLQAFSLTSS